MQQTQSLNAKWTLKQVQGDEGVGVAAWSHPELVSASYFCRGTEVRR